MSTESTTVDLGSSQMTFETGRMARLADGAVTVQCGETVVLCTAVSQTKVREGQSWFPLSVEYKEKAAAAGKFPGGYFKREGRPTEKEILTCRMTDRPIRALFPKGYLYDTQLVCLLLSADGEVDSDILAMNGAALALSVSDIPFDGPLGCVRVGLVDGQFIANPSHEQREESEMDLVYAGKRGGQVIMIEGEGDEIPEQQFKDALQFASEQVDKILDAQEAFIAKVGKPKRTVELTLAKEELLEVAYEVAGDRIEDAIYAPTKVERGKAVEALRAEVKEAILAKDESASDFDIDQAFDYLQKKAFRKSIMEQGKRADGRAIETIRPLTAEIDIMPRAHGSSLFARGETQALALATLAPLDESQFLDNYAGGKDTKRFILHYHFPPFSVGETGRMGGLNRREIGHGDLAERSIAPVLPDEDTFPYAVRLTSEVMESNGSTSMASVCSGSMALLEAGVPISRHVAGISVGLVTEFDGDTMKEYKMLMDIIGSEDFFGDMDFKLCGTSEGVTGYQLDLKLPGIPLSMLNEAIDKAANGRKEVLAVMDAAISTPSELSENAPRIESIKINPDRIGELIGPGGKNIKAIQAESGADLNIEDDGTVHVYAIKRESLERAKQMVEGMFAEIEVGKVYTGKVVSITKFGAFMQVLPGKDGLVHISELAEGRVNKVEDICSEGDIMSAKCIGIDDKGRVKMSRRAALQDADEAAGGGEEAAPEVAEAAGDDADEFVPGQG